MKATNPATAEIYLAQSHDERLLTAQMTHSPLSTTFRVRATIGLGVLAALTVTDKIHAQVQDPPQRPNVHQRYDTQPKPPETTSTGPFRYLDISFNVLTAAGTSTASNAILADLQRGQHDPRRRGFTLQQAEFAARGGITENLEGHFYLISSLDPVEGETIIELEEAFLVSRDLPSGLQFKIGTYFTEFGRFNPRHPHEWDFIDQPVIMSRVFGPDGMRGPGARIAWRSSGKTPFEALIGIQNANGETMPSFLANDEVYEERGIGGRQFTQREINSGDEFVYTGRLTTVFEVGDNGALGLGASVGIGPNATGDGGDTLLWGADMVLEWAQEGEQETGDGHVHGHVHLPKFRLEAEVLGRRFDAVSQVDDSMPSSPVTIPSATLEDYGGYVQALYGFSPHWAVGLRAEMATGSGQSYLRNSQTFGRRPDPDRTDRFRITPMLTWQQSENASVRLAYNYDDSDHLAGDEHTVWIGFSYLIGRHPTHRH